MAETLSQYERAAMLGRLVRLAADLLDAELIAACSVFESWEESHADDEPAPLRLMLESSPGAGTPGEEMV